MRVGPALVALGWLLASSSGALASTARPLPTDELWSRAATVIDGTVTSIETSWTTDHRALETTATITIETTRKGPAAAAVAVVFPGGELGTSRQHVSGMPMPTVGQRARWFLVRRADGRHRVLGWGQGIWPAAPADRTRFLPPAIAPPDRLEFTTNGMVWPDGATPVPYLLHEQGSDDLPLADVESAVQAAFAAWQAVSCARLAFTYAGTTALDIGVDDLQVIRFIESGWVYGEEAAGATSLWIVDGEQTADIAFNGEDYTWAIDPAGSAAPDTLDLQAILTHEVGHFAGLGHSQRAFDTMYYSWTPWQGQRSLSVDDKLGLCALYPVAIDECLVTGDCGDGMSCDSHPLGRLCSGSPDPLGTPCNYDRVECEEFCLFTKASLSEGYCSRYCEGDADCPLTHHCADASAGGDPVKVCFEGAQPMPDGGAGACDGDGDCPAGQHCDAAASLCTFECRRDQDCSRGDVCDQGGACAPGGGCQTAPRPDGNGLWLIAIVGALAVRRRRRAGLPQVTGSRPTTRR